MDHARTCGTRSKLVGTDAGSRCVDLLSRRRRMTNAELDEQIADIDSQRPPTFTDEALALRFAERHKDELRYVASQSKWFLYDGMQWSADDTLHAFAKSRRL